MKKILFCAGLLALAASCAENELDSISGQNGATRGISFEGTLVEAPTTRGDLVYDDVSGVHSFFWYAEKDQISIWSTNTTATGSNIGNNTAAWVKANSAKYKATQSKAKGVFTAVDDNNILDFQWGLGTTGGEKDWTNPDNEQFKSQFLATYPSTVKLEADKNDGKFEFSTLPALTAQEQNTLDGQDVTSKIMMISLTKAVKENSYDAVGEKIDLNFNRPFTAVVFRTKGIDKEYAEIFGKLTSIELAAKGYDKNENGTVEQGDIAGSYLDYGSAHYLYDSNKPEESKLVKDDGSDITDMNADVSNAAQKITLTLGSGSGLEFMDGNLAYMAINKIDRKAFRDAKVKETIAMKFSFEHIDLPKTVETDSNWPTMNNMFIGGTPTTLDINSFSYLVTNQSGKRTLIVNKGTFSQIFTADGSKVKWNDGADQEYPLTDFTNIISKVELTTEELAKLKGFTGVKSIKLAENTTIPAKTFDGLTALTSINLPKVTTVEKGAFVSAKLESVIMPAYKFADDGINPEILNKATLVTLDMSAVDKMGAVFPGKGLNLSGYENLEKVTVKDGLLVGASSFSGCVKLKEINGAITFSESTGAFKGCVELPEINITNTVIPADAFSGCTKLENVLNNGKQVLPTSVGNQAFMDCVALEEMNLSLATKIGEQSFKGCTALYGVTDAAESNKKIMYVGATTIPFEAFDGCTALEYVHFMEATSFAEDILKNCTLKEVKFKKAFTLDSSVTYTATTFGKNTGAVKLFINPEQSVKTFNNNTLILRSVNISFLSITKE